MKKLLWIPATFLAMALCVLPTDGAEVGSREIDVNARYQVQTKAPATYSVDLAWSDMTFTYVQEEKLTWNAKDHSYKSRSSGKWENNKGAVTVTNHSNVDIQVEITYTPLDDTGITGTLKNGSRKLKAGKEGDYEGAAKMTATLTVSGKPNEKVTAQGTKIGSLKITIR